MSGKSKGSFWEVVEEENRCFYQSCKEPIYLSALCKKHYTEVYGDIYDLHKLAVENNIKTRGIVIEIIKTLIDTYDIEEHELF